MRLRVVSTAASLLAAVPVITHALGLGDIQLKSTLNAPLNAEIELIATAEEMASLRTQLASRDTFSRYGLDYPAFLTGIQVRPVRLADGRNVIQLTSSAAMTEPFATILVEAVWARGRNLREYTVLLDPPTFAPPQAAAPAPVAAPVTGAGERSGAIARPAPAPVAAPAPASDSAAPAAAAGGQYTVRSGDSLSGIARRQYGSEQIERGMIAVYRANQQAFDGNINLLRAGAILRLPDGEAVSAMDSGEARSEVRRQMASWSAGAGAAASAGDDARLRLVPPGGTSAGGGSAETQTLRDRVSQLESELAESRRLLELRNSELARLQGAGTPAPAPAPVPKPVEEEMEAQPLEPVVEEAPPAEPVAEETPAPAEPEAVASEPAAEDSGLMALLTRFWFVPVGVLVLLGALVAIARRRRESAEEFTPFAVSAEPDPVGRDTSSDTFPLRKPGPDGLDPNILVEESGTHQRPSFERRETRTVDLDEGTASSMSVPALDATSALDQGDPLAEADFHMAYGLYDQAADLVKLAIQREPTRRDLKLKLLEVFFVWGNKDQFLQTARELSDSRDEGQPGEWEKVVIMGKQLAPEDALFSQSYSGVGPASVDLNLEGGQNLVDFDLQGDPSVSLNPDGSVDMALDAPGTGTAEMPEFSGGVDFMLDDPSRGDDPARTATTRQMAQPGFDNEAAPTQRMAIDGPTVEQPALDVNDTLATKLEAQLPSSSTDQTAELAIDDLGLDLGKLEGTGTNLLDDSRLVRALESSDAPTLVAGMDDTSRRLLEDSSDANQPTELLPLSDFDSDAGATSRVQSLDLDLDIDSDSNAETGKRAAITGADFNLDLDVGSPEQQGDGEFQRTQRIDPAPQVDSDLTEKDLEPVTMSEVGTKLDLARAYMDMGDPDGARSILNEVLQEGSASQRQEAQRLLDSVPG